MDIHLLDQSGEVTDTIRWETSQITKPDVDFTHKIRLRYGSFPPQTIEVEDERFAAELKRSYPGYAFARRDMVAVVSSRWKWVAAAFLVLLGFGAFAFLVVVPNVAEYAATKVPLSVERTIGESAYGQFTALSDEDSARSRLVQEFFDAIPGERKYDYTITVLNSDEQNAFAMPGGRIVVYSAMLDSIRSSPQFAALLLHESAHVELQHSLKSLFRTLSGYFFISLLFGDTGGITAVVFENIYVFKDLQYSREMERQADITGLKNMQSAGIDPAGMVDLFRMLEDDTVTTQKKHELSEFVSTHPLTAHRISYIRQYVVQDSARYSNSPVLDSLLARIRTL